jgi:LuxR family maltose regulon positive regulatory protein
VARPALVERLVAAAPGELVVVTAAAGYGKTITAALWEQADPRPFAWVALDGLDDDPAHLVAHVATALAAQGLVDNDDVRFLSLPGRSPIGELVPMLGELLVALGPFVLLFDDVHLVSDPSAIDTLVALVDAAPSTAVVALLSRTPPLRGTARRRLSDGVVELRPADLALDASEARRAFAGLGVDVSDHLLRDVLDRSEGWAGGVHLAALVLRDRPDDADSPFTGRNRLVADYLVEEVLEGLEPELVTFMEEASLLSPMDADILDAVLERDDAGLHLLALETSGNLFLVPLDDERRWYRFHHLFAELLQARLRLRDPARMRRIHGRASELFELTGDTDAAIDHAVAAGDRARAASLVQRDAVALAFDGRSGVLRRRLATLGDDTVRTNADAAVAAAWAALADADLGVFRTAVSTALELDHEGPLADGSVSPAAAVALMAAILGEDGLDGVIRHSTRVIDAGGPQENPWWGMATTLRATAYIQLGRYDEARVDLVAALPDLGRLTGFEAGSLMLLAWLHLREGDLTSTLRYAEAGRRIADRHELEGVVPLLVLYACEALVSARTGNRERAIAAVPVVETSIERLGEESPRMRLFAHLMLTETYHALADGAAARHHLTETIRIERNHPLAPEVGLEIERLRTMIDGGLAGSSLAVTPLTGAERRLLPHLATHLSLPQIAAELHVSRNTVKTHCVSIYRKLGVASRAEAVTEARRLGLLPA